MIAVVTTAGAAQLTGRPLQPQGCYASLTRPPYGRPLTLEPLSTLAAGSTAGHGLPPLHAPPQLIRTQEPRSTTNPRGTRGPIRFLARTSTITWDRNVKRQMGPDKRSAMMQRDDDLTVGTDTRREVDLHEAELMSFGGHG